jgi:predicted dehydrogenase
MKVLIAGLGSIGRRHLANIRTLEPEADIVAWRRPGSGVAAEADSTVHSLAEAIAAKPDIAVLAGPATAHIAPALELARAGVHLLIEKPLSDQLTGIDELLRLRDEGSLAIMIGYNLRFDSSLASVRRLAVEGKAGRVLAMTASVGMYLPDWRKGADYRTGVSAQKCLGGGAVLELSHEIDYCQWIAGRAVAVTASTAHVSDLDIDVEDVADILLECESGARVNIHLDMLDRLAHRSCRIVGTDGTLVWDATSDNDRNAMYLAEMRHFLACAATGAPCLIPLEDARNTLQVALAAKQSSETGKTVRL